MEEWDVLFYCNCFREFQGKNAIAGYKNVRWTKIHSRLYISCSADRTPERSLIATVVYLGKGMGCGTSTQQHPKVSEYFSILSCFCWNFRTCHYL